MKRVAEQHGPAESSHDREDFAAFARASAIPSASPLEANDTAIAVNNHQDIDAVPRCWLGEEFQL